MKKILICLVCTLLLAGCGTATAGKDFGGNPSGSATADPAAPPGNFAYASSTEAMFPAWVNTNGSLSGQTQDARIQPNNGSEQVNSKPTHDIVALPNF